jgi:hypothetical protein
MTDLLNINYFLEVENREFTNGLPNELNTLFIENNMTPVNFFEFNNINGNNLNYDEEGPTGYTYFINHHEPEFLNRERRRGRGRGESNGNGHNKYAFDNMLRKTKCMIIKEVFNFINKKIFIIYNGIIGHGDNIKKLFLINHAQVSNANIDFNRTFLGKTLGEIFSADLTKRIINYKRDHNKKLIEKLINEEDEEKNEYFNGLFNLTFLDCLKYFRNENVNHAYVYIEGLKRFSDLENNAIFRKTNEPDFIEQLGKFINNYEYNLSQRRGRNPIHNYNIEN